MSYRYTPTELGLRVEYVPDEDDDQDEDPFPPSDSGDEHKPGKETPPKHPMDGWRHPGYVPGEHGPEIQTEIPDNYDRRGVSLVVPLPDAPRAGVFVQVGNVVMEWADYQAQQQADMAGTVVFANGKSYIPRYWGTSR